MSDVTLTIKTIFGCVCGLQCGCLCKGRTYEITTKPMKTGQHLVDMIYVQNPYARDKALKPTLVARAGGKKNHVIDLDDMLIKYEFKSGDRIDMFVPVVPFMCSGPMWKKPTPKAEKNEAEVLEAPPEESMEG
eukprot:GHVH01004283.1.p2 GENE.GHVH01004283.1~~GHVH01004283.1.p2  ORF type:complete len:133 (+),score=22.20 GHVH01004283.1:149-547(+)